MKLPTAQDIENTYELIRDHIHKTPVLTSTSLNKMFGCQLFFKCENLQKTGAFKIRGALNSVKQLGTAQNKGFITHSSGNHGAALAYACQLQKIRCLVVMPHNAPEAKKKATASYGAEIVFCEPTQEAREKTTQAIAVERNYFFIPPFDYFDVICGQGTVALELLKEVDLDYLLVPAGGGGLIGGMSTYYKEKSPLTKVIGIEPEAAADLYVSMQKGERVVIPAKPTIADGLRMNVGVLNFAIIHKKVDHVFTVKDESIANAMELIASRMKIVVEPSACVGLAAILEEKISKNIIRGKKIGIVLSGGNR